LYICLAIKGWGIIFQPSISTTNNMTAQKPGVINAITGDLKKGALQTFVLALLFIISISGKCTLVEFLMSFPFFLIFYYFQFVIGRESVINYFRHWIGNNSYNVLVFPTVMFLLYLVYLVQNGQNILQGNPWLLVYIVYFPVVVFALKNDPKRKIGWLDFTVFVLALLPTAFFSIKQNSEVPFHGGGFDSLSHIMIILTGAYAFGVVRGIKDVGFILEFNLKSFVTAMLVWVSFYLVVFVFGRSVHFIEVVGYSVSFDILVKSIFFSFIGTFLHTALFEELFFRGILQNMLTKRIAHGKSWFIFWVTGFVLLLAGAFLVGYTLEGKMKWFPALMTTCMFVAAYLIEKSGKYGFGVYTSLAITGVTFGLVHYHAKSIIYIGLACVAGWAYGYTYIKTKNVFYSALVHTLVNTGMLIFGLKMNM
jgi:uncharacterized protein